MKDGRTETTMQARTISISEQSSPDGTVRWWEVNVVTTDCSREHRSTEVRMVGMFESLELAEQAAETER